MIADGCYMWFRIRGMAHRSDDGTALHMSGSIQDISVEKSILEALNKEREEARVILDNIPSYVFYKDHKDQVVRANKAAASFTGIESHEMVGMTFAELFPSKGDIHFQRDQEFFESGESKLSTIDEYIDENGKSTWVRTDRVLVGDERGQERLLVVSTDITELKEAEDRVRESDARMELALRAGEMGTWEWNLADDSIDWDRTQTVLMGIPDAPLHVETHVFVDRVYPDDIELLGNELRRLIKDQDSSDFHIEFRILYPSGEMRWIAAKGRGIFDAEGWAIGVTGVTYDITDYKDNERQIQRTLENQKVLNNLLEISFLDTKLEEKLQYCLSVILRSFDVEMQSAGGIFIQSIDPKQRHLTAVTMYLTDSLIERLRRVSDRLVDQFVALQKNTIVRIPAAPDDVSKSFASTRAYFRFDVPLVEGELHLGVLVLYLQNVEELTELEREYLQSVSSAISTLIMRDRTISALKEARELAEQGTRAKSAFLASMSHELRTPLNSIIGFTQRLLKRTKSVLSERDFDSLHTVDRNAKHLLHLINDILDLSKIEAGKISLLKREFNLVDEIRGIVETLAPLADAKAISLQSISASDDIHVFADKTKIIQIVTNLLSNAIKYTDTGSIQIVVTPLNQRTVAIRIIDTGIGIKQKNLSQLFRKFTQLEDSERREGTGLGLTITKEYVEMHGGRIEVQSEWGVGSTFSAMLPILLSSSVDGDTIEAADSAGDSITILCVDNDPEVLEALQTTFEAEGCTVRLARTYAEAYGIAVSTVPDLICLDLSLPDKSGYDLIQILKQHSFTGNIPIVVFTGIEDFDARFESQVDSLLSKQAEETELLGQIRGILARDVGKILIADNCPSTSKLLKKHFEESSIEPVLVATAEDAMREVESNSYAAMVLDVDMPGLDGETLLNLLSAKGYTKRLPVFVFSAEDKLDDVMTKGVAEALIYKKGDRPSIILMSIIRYFIRHRSMEDNDTSNE